MPCAFGTCRLMASLWQRHKALWSLQALSALLDLLDLSLVATDDINMSLSMIHHGACPHGSTMLIQLSIVHKKLGPDSGRPQTETLPRHLQ